MTPIWAVPLGIPVGLDREEARRRAVEELAKAKYGGRPSWVDHATDRAIRLIERAYDLYLRISNAPGGGGKLNWGFVIAVLVLLVGLALVIWKVGLPRWRRRGPAGALQLDSTVAAADYRALADEHAQRGDYQAAIRDRFRGLVRDLETRTILEVRPARTAWEAAYSAVRVVPAAREALFAGADQFNRVVYGDEPADAAGYAQLVAVDETVVSAADQVDLAAATEGAPAP